MESQEIKDNPIEKSIHWLKFWKTKIFLCILAGFSFLVYLIEYFVLKDVVYLYLSLLCPLGIAIWICGLAIVWYRKAKKEAKEE
ncbi:MAG: hypothetical protein K2O22_03470 [Anaeroplasmataceae bacterium]|nr:hypothetical protein [Anaeroplasmataceae bacterium]